MGGAPVRPGPIDGTIFAAPTLCLLPPTDPIMHLRCAPIHPLPGGTRSGENPDGSMRFESQDGPRFARVFALAALWPRSTGRDGEVESIVRRMGRGLDNA